jgi:molecular chaperone DnaK (HSP70)
VCSSDLYSFGVSYLGERGGVEYPHCYKPIIHRNTPLPLTRTERYFTSYAGQTEVDVHVYQGDDEDALRNIPVGEFRIEGLTPMDEPTEVLCRMRLDLDGILEVAAVEKLTGKSKRITIDGALRAKSPEEIAAGRKRILELYGTDRPVWDMDARAGQADGDIEAAAAHAGNDNVIEMPATPPSPQRTEAQDLLERSRRLLDGMHAEDREEAIGLHESIEAALASGDSTALAEASKALKELLFFVEGQS